jgi:hypothetical protein
MKLKFLLFCILYTINLISTQNYSEINPQDLVNMLKNSKDMREEGKEGEERKQKKLQQQKKAKKIILKPEITAKHKQMILNAHNYFRNSIALKLKTKIPNELPYALNMKQMYWSEQLAINAQKWADEGNFIFSDRDRRKVKIKRGKKEIYSGENIFMESNLMAFPTMNWETAISSWYEELKGYHGDVNIFDYEVGTAQFTQLIWAETYLVGCGFSQYQDSENYSNLYVCQYGPAGNVWQTPVYKSSPNKGCTCPDVLTCSNPKYKGLCCVKGMCDMEAQNFHRITHREGEMKNLIHKNINIQADKLGIEGAPGDQNCSK